jgi:hypothetical protein
MVQGCFTVGENFFGGWVIIFPVGGIDSYWDWLNLELGNQGCFSGIEGDVSIGFVSTSLGGAGSLDGSVGISVLSGDTVSLDIVKSSWWHTSIASHVKVSPGGAVNQLLFREAGEFTSVDEEVSFQNSGCSEWPTWSALSLVLDFSDCTFGNPIDAVGIGVQGRGDSLLGQFWFLDSEGKIDLSKFLVGQIEKHGFTENILSFFGIEFFGEDHILSIDWESVSLFCWSIFLVEFSLEILERSFVVSNILNRLVVDKEYWS